MGDFHCMLLFYDITDIYSFNELKIQVLKHVEEYKSRHPDTVIMLIGAKLDLQITMRGVPRQLGEKLAKEHGFLFMEVSAFTGENVETVFYNTVDIILQNIMKKKKLDFAVLQGDGLLDIMLKDLKKLVSLAENPRKKIMMIKQRLLIILKRRITA